MTHHVLLRQADHGDVVEPVQLGADRGQAGEFRQQVGLVRIARHDHGRVPAETGEQHLELAVGAVLGFVDQHESVVQRAAAHEGHRRDLDRAVVEMLAQALRPHPVVQGVPQRAQVGVELLAHVARQEAQVLARFDGRPRQHDARDGACIQGFDGGGDREVGLAGPCRSQRHGQRFGFYRLHQDPLVVGPRPDLLDVALIALIGRSVVENDVVNTGAVDGVQLGSACGAFGHILTPVSWSGERDRSPKTKTPPVSGGVGDRWSG